MTDKPTTCFNCWHSTFRSKNGIIALYCRLYHRAVRNGGTACTDHINYDKNDLQ